MRKGDEIFSKEELAALRMFAKNAVEEDKKLCGISDKNTKKIRKGDEIFSKDELATLKAFAKKAVEKDKKKENNIKKPESIKNIQSQIKTDNKNIPNKMNNIKVNETNNSGNEKPKDSFDKIRDNPFAKLGKNLNEKRGRNIFKR